MFDVSSGEIIVCIGIGAAMIGRKDLPAATHYLGKQVGRMVGMLQGARAKADRFASTDELHDLQKEVRRGLRELDAVKSEIAIASTVNRGLGNNRFAGSRGMSVGGEGETGTSSGMGTGNQGISTSMSGVASPLSNTMASPAVPMTSGSEYLADAKESETDYRPSPLPLASRDHAVRAVAEEEWNKNGIGFQSRAEMGTGAWSRDSSLSAEEKMSSAGGSVILADLIQQSLIHDQYDRTVMEQDEILMSKVKKFEKGREESGKK